MSEGLPTETPLAEKLWAVAKIQGHKNPWRDEVLSMTVPQIDFILEMEARDNPREWVFERVGQVSSKRAAVVKHAALYNFFVGDAHMRHAPRLNPAVLAMRRKAAEQAKALGVRRAKPQKVRP